MFIVFEGIDGSGKTTLSKELYKFFVRKGIKAVWTKEPYSEEIRNLILKGNLNPWAETFLFLGDRNLHVRELVKPSLKEGFTVISDRYYLSTLAYQGYGRGLDVEKLKKLNDKSVEGLKPDLVFLLDLEVEKALERLKKSRKNLDSFEDFEFLNRVRRGFLELSELESNIFVLDANKNIYTLLGEILKILDGFMEKRI